MDSQHLQDLSDGIEDMYKSMRHIIEIVFAISPLLVLSTYGWGWRSVSGAYLLRVSELDIISWQIL